MFLYNITSKTGQFEIIKDSIAVITEDRRLQALLIASSFGAFIESPQSLVVGTSSTGLAGREGELFRFTLPYSLLITFLVGLVALIQAYIFPWMIPAADIASTTPAVAASGGKIILLVTGLAISVFGMIIYRIRSDNQEK